MAGAIYDCLAAGIVVADHVCDPVERLPLPGELVTTSRLDLTIGGCAANVATDLAKLGQHVGVIGKVGDDIFGRFVREQLEAANVDCTYLARSVTSETSGTLVINTRGEDRRFIHSVGANAEFTGREITAEQIRSCRSLYVGGFCLIDSLAAENVATVFRLAREAGVITLLDVVISGTGDYRGMLEPVLPWTDVFLPNSDEGRVILGIDDPVRQAAEFRRLGASTVVVTCADDGAVLNNADVSCRIGSHDVEFVDGTGGGDAFAAGYIYGLLNDAPAEECLKYGSALGASSVRTRGATTCVFSRDELEAFVSTHPLPVAKIGA
jgi:sugar/nucleoside kinase (ribokinase family)